MRVLHWYPNFLAGGAVASAVLGLAGAQARIGIEVLVAAIGARDERPGPPGIGAPTGVTVLSWTPAWRLGAGTRILRGMSRSDRRRFAGLHPDIVHVHGEFALDNLRVPALFLCPRIISPHGAFHPQVLKKSRLGKELYLLLARRTLHRDAAFHALSPAEQRDILRVAPHAKTSVFPNGPSPQMERCMAGWRDGEPAPARPPARVSFLFAGRLDVYHKGLDIMLEAFALASGALPGTDMALVLAGPDFGDGTRRLRRQAALLGLQTRVRFPGTLQAAELARAYREADVYLQVSRNDAFPLSVVEAFCACIPTILSAEVGIASYEQVASRPYVAVVTLDARAIAEKMIDFAQNRETLKRHARESRSRITHFFSWDRAATASVETYRALME